MQLQEVAKMLRYIYRLLLLALVLTTPLSCCGDKCPDFTPVFEIQESYRSKATATVAQQGTTTQSYAIAFLEPVQQNVPFPPSPSLPNSINLSPPLHERAPPQKNLSAA